MVIINITYDITSPAKDHDAASYSRIIARIARKTNDMFPRVFNFMVAKPGRNMIARSFRDSRTVRSLARSLGFKLPTSFSLSTPSLLISIFN